MLLHHFYQSSLSLSFFRHLQGQVIRGSSHFLWDTALCIHVIVIIVTNFCCAYFNALCVFGVGQLGRVVSVPSCLLPV